MSDDLAKRTADQLTKAIEDAIEGKPGMRRIFPLHFQCSYCNHYDEPTRQGGEPPSRVNTEHLSEPALKRLPCDLSEPT